MDDREYEYLKRQIASLLDIDIDAYKSRQMRRRLTTFVQSRAGDSPAPFLRRLAEDAEALSDLREMLTINVTEFFRDGAQFETLERTVLPELLKKRLQLRVWSAGCSRGHEPYSVAIMLDELGAAARSLIVATDLDRGALRIAKARGPYPEGELRNVSRLRRSRYFSAVGGGFEVDGDLARRVQFRELNLLRDRFDHGFDLVICRNVMIYFSAEVKVALVRRFCDSLSPDGVLFIGATEALLGDEVDGFERMGGNFYRKVDATAERPRVSSRAA
jgi:chemotaxis protein methyltransferase CheR